MTDGQANPTASDPAGRSAMNRLLALGLILRVGWFFTATPFNVDDHLGVIDWIVAHRALPVSNLLQQSYHPPLYYLLAAPLRAMAPTAKWPLHGFALLLSCANLWCLRRLMDDPSIVALNASRAWRVATFALVATLAQFVAYGSYVSNDPLAFLIGTLLFAATLRYVRDPTRGRLATVAVLVALGLLTKGTFLLAGVALAPVVLRVEWSRGRRRAVVVAIAFCAAWLVLGSYKYVDNLVRLGRPFVHNQEQYFRGAAGRSIWRGPQTAYDLDVTKLIRHPRIEPASPPSYGLTLYASFWYAFVDDRNAKGALGGYDAVGRMAYAAAVVPTLLAALGAAAGFAAIGRWVRDGRDAPLVVALALLVANLAVVVAAGARFDVWEAFQGRLLFPSVGPLAALLLAGAARLPRSGAIRGVALAFCWAAAACGVLFLLVEFAIARHLLPIENNLYI